MARVIKMVRSHPTVMEYLPSVPDDGKAYIEREFLFDIVNTVDSQFFKTALAQIEVRRGFKA